jgi:hypothetical protein
MVAGGDRALLGSQNRGDDVIACARRCRAVNGGDVEDVALDDDTVGFSPSTSAMLTVVDVIDTPSTISTAAPTHLLGIFGSGRARVPRKR